MTYTEISINLAISIVAGIITGAIYYFLDKPTHTEKSITSINNYILNINHPQQYPRSLSTNNGNSSDSSDYFIFMIIFTIGSAIFFSIYLNMFIEIGWKVGIGAFSATLTVVIFRWVKEKLIEPLTIWLLFGWIGYFFLLWSLAHPSIPKECSALIEAIKIHGINAIKLDQPFFIIVYQAIGLMLLVLYGILLIFQVLFFLVRPLIYQGRVVFLIKITISILSKYTILVMIIFGIIDYFLVSGRFAVWYFTQQSHSMNQFLDTIK